MIYSFLGGGHCNATRRPGVQGIFTLMLALRGAEAAQGQLEGHGSPRRRRNGAAEAARLARVSSRGRCVAAAAIAGHRLEAGLFPVGGRHSAHPAEWTGPGPGEGDKADTVTAW